MSDGDLSRLPSNEPADSPSMPATSSRHQQLKTLAVTIGVAFTVVIILISRFQPLTLQARTSGWQVASDTSPNVSVTVDNTVTDNSIFHVTVTALRTRVEGPLPVLTQGVTLCCHFDPVQQQCISGGGASLVKPFRPFASSDHQLEGIEETFTLRCGSSERFENVATTVGVDVTYHFWWFSHTVFLTTTLPSLLASAKCCSTSSPSF